MLEPVTQSRSELLDPTPVPLVAAASPRAGVSEHPSEDLIRQAISYLDSAGKTPRPGHPDDADRILELLRLATAHLELALAPRDGLILPGSFHGAE